MVNILFQFSHVLFWDGLDNGLKHVETTRCEGYLKYRQANHIYTIVNPQKDRKIVKLEIQGENYIYIDR